LAVIAAGVPDTDTLGLGAAVAAEALAPEE